MTLTAVDRLGIDLRRPQHQDDGGHNGWDKHSADHKMDLH